MNLDQIADMYNRGYDYNPGSVSSLGWSSRYTQTQRFLVLSLVDDLEDKSILDVGSGMGDFYTFLLENQVECEYTGIDISEKMLAHAKKVHPNVPFMFGNVLDLPAKPSYDIVLCSGAFNHRTEEPYPYVFAVITHLFSLCKKATAFNLLSSSTPPNQQDTETFTYFSPVKILEFCLTLTPYVELRQSYLPNDFTVFLYKNQV
jgi:ubiquinone/menaquinone biosynthesis C-methylase UbiE